MGFSCYLANAITVSPNEFNKKRSCPSYLLIILTKRKENCLECLFALLNGLAFRNWKIRQTEMVFPHNLLQMIKNNQNWDHIVSKSMIFYVHTILLNSEIRITLNIIIQATCLACISWGFYGFSPCINNLIHSQDIPREKCF